MLQSNVGTSTTGKNTYSTAFPVARMPFGFGIRKSTDVTKDLLSKKVRLFIEFSKKRVDHMDMKSLILLTGLFAIGCGGGSTTPTGGADGGGAGAGAWYTEIASGGVLSHLQVVEGSQKAIWYKDGVGIVEGTYTGIVRTLVPMKEENTFINDIFMAHDNLSFIWAQSTSSGEFAAPMTTVFSRYTFADDSQAIIYSRPEEVPTILSDTEIALAPDNNTFYFTWAGVKDNFLYSYTPDTQTETPIGDLTVKQDGESGFPAYFVDLDVNSITGDIIGESKNIGTVHIAKDTWIRTSIGPRRLYNVSGAISLDEASDRLFVGGDLRNSIDSCDLETKDCTPYYKHNLRLEEDVVKFNHRMKHFSYDAVDNVLVCIGAKGAANQFVYTTNDFISP